jgi:hypothetical protein
VLIKQQICFSPLNSKTDDTSNNQSNLYDTQHWENTLKLENAAKNPMLLLVVYQHDMIQ